MRSLHRTPPEWVNSEFHEVHRSFIIVLLVYRRRESLRLFDIVIIIDPSHRGSPDQPPPNAR